MGQKIFPWVAGALDIFISILYASASIVYPGGVVVALKVVVHLHRIPLPSKLCCWRESTMVNWRELEDTDWLELP